MKTTQAVSDTSSNVFLTGTILMANFDFPGLADYAFKAMIGAAIWMVFKIIADIVSEKVKNRKQ